MSGLKYAFLFEPILKDNVYSETLPVLYKMYSWLRETKQSIKHFFFFTIQILNEWICIYMYYVHKQETTRS